MDRMEYTSEFQNKVSASERSNVKVPTLHSQNTVRWKKAKV